MNSLFQELNHWLPLIVSLIAGAFALHQIRSNNITNARLKWLEIFKQLISDFLSECSTLQLKAGVKKSILEDGLNNSIPENALEYINNMADSTFEHLKIIEAKYHQIKLNLNPKEPLHQKLEQLLENYMSLFNSIPLIENSKNYDALIRKMRAHSDTLVYLIRFIFILEWEKTKRSYFSRKWYMKLGKGSDLFFEAMNLKLLPESPAPLN